MSSIQGGGDDNVNLTLQAMKSVSREEVQEVRAEQESSQESFLASQAEAVNPFAAKFATKEKEIKTQTPRLQKALQAEKGERMLPVEAIKDKADQFERRNPELRAGVLALLREQIKDGDTKEDILRKLAEFYPDVSLADEALEFLLETCGGDLAKVVQEAKEEFQKQHGREIAAGKNIGTQAREAAEKGLGTPTSLRDMYRDITGNPRDSPTLFEELSSKYAFKDLKKVVDFLLHSLGADMKSKGPSIPRGMLHNLISETRALQAILGVYRFFRGRMALVEKMFANEGLDMPSQLSFESMAKQFMTLAADRYPSAAKVLTSAGRLGIEKWIIAKIIVFSQLRDAIRQVAVHQIYKSMQHRDELYMSLLEALEDLEDQLEDLLEEKEEGEGKEEEEGKEEGEEKDQEQEEEKKE